ncbi:ABC transporter ATP-binding protein [Clostridium tagluense]|uniref:ABC transporter ATP-binding protein n=1 Tax=Clostridium tagluense TaxID=360422 RepID=UPI001CF159E1|nr:ABC transporter ATP-binding protein [Clostridium tagluense]MCB2297535.1 ABC transporter ATP-binding protein [Clostridium tagluense]
MKIRLENISKEYKDVLAVNQLNVDIEDGSLVCLLGPSGCGKSTTLSMIAGLDKPTGGNIYFDGVNVNDVQAEHRDIGMVFQDYALYPHMSVMENIEFPLKMRKWNKKRRLEKVSQVVKVLQIEELLHRKPSKLSGGQQQRVAIARALVKDPKILLLDEPLSNLDARLRIELRDEIRSLQKKLQITTIFVTHDQEEALSISDKILLLDKGKLQQYSSPKKMYMEPENRFVAGFLGNPPMNFINGILDNKKLFIIETDKKIQVQADYINNFKNYDSGNHLLGIRPEDLILSENKSGVSGTIVSIQTLGKEVHIKFSVENIILKACVSWDHNYAIGDHVDFDIKRIHIFN